MTRLALRVIAPLTLLLLATDLVSGITSEHNGGPVYFAVATGVGGTAFVIAGLLAWRRPLGDAIGALMVCVGLAWLFFASLWNANEPLLYTLGNAFGSIPIALLLYLVAVYPLGRPTTRPERLLALVLLPVAVLANLLPVLFQDRFGFECKQCSENRFLVSDQPGVYHGLTYFFTAVGVVFFLGVVLLAIRRWRSATPAMRRVLMPVYLTGGIAVAAIGIGFAAGYMSETAGTVLWLTAFVGVIALPFAVVAGLVRSKLMLGLRQLLDYADVPTTVEAQDAIRRALGDPTARVGYWLGRASGYVDVDGDPFPVRLEAPGRMTAPIVSTGGGPLGVIDHDAALAAHEPEVLEQVVNACRIALEKDRGRLALQASETRSRALLAASPDLMIRFRADGTYLDIEGDTSGLVRAPEEMIGGNITDFLPEEVVGPLVQCARRALELGGMQTVEYQLEVAGQLRDFEARMVPVGADELISVVRDFTNQRRLETALQERLAELEREQEFTRTVVQTAPIVILLVDTHGRIVRFNQTCEELFGHADDEQVRGRHFWKVFVAPDCVDAATRSVDRLAAGEPHVEYETRWRTRSGLDRTIAVSGAPILDGRGEPHYLFCGLDVTERERHAAAVRASRARIVEAQDGERRRLERNLHDGAQQRLVSVSLALRLAQGRLEEDPEDARAILTGAGEELALALEELRELARGIHPAILTDRGLAAALQSLADRAPYEVSLDAVPEERLPAQVEAAAFYVVSESLTNVAKYAQASVARVSVTRMNGRALVEVIDNGVGGADPTLGSGLRGLADRVEALDGHLEVTSAPGAGTQVRAEIPCA
jgi:PAS domain S-box-containing protein